MLFLSSIGHAAPYRAAPRVLSHRGSMMRALFLPLFPHFAPRFVIPPRVTATNKEEDPMMCLFYQGPPAAFPRWLRVAGV